MRIEDLSPPLGAKKRKKKVGRGSGSGHGKTSCRGNKGQKSRTGRKPRLGFEGGQMPIIRKIPKRGFTSFNYNVEVQPIKVGSLNIFEKKVTVVDVGELRRVNLIKSTKRKIKILGGGKLNKPLTVKAHAFSSRAIKQIEKAGGKAIVQK